MLFPHNNSLTDGALPEEHGAGAESVHTHETLVKDVRDEDEENISYVKD